MPSIPHPSLLDRLNILHELNHQNSIPVLLNNMRFDRVYRIKLL